MAGREVREYTNLSDPKDKKWGKGKERVDDEEVTFQRLVSRMQDVAGERGGYLHGRGALDSDDLLYLKEQMEAEEDAERLLRRTEKRAFMAFKKAVADSSQASVPLPLRVEPKPKSGIRQQDLLKRVVEIKPKRQKVSSPSDASNSPTISSGHASTHSKSEINHEDKKSSPARSNETSGETKVEKPISSPSRSKKIADETKVENPVKSLLAAYESSDDEAAD